jgi:hypothetical protein
MKLMMLVGLRDIHNKVYIIEVRNTESSHGRRELQSTLLFKVLLVYPCEARSHVNYIYNPVFLEVCDFPEPPTTSASSADKYLQRSVTLQGRWFYLALSCCSLCTYNCAAQLRVR